MVKLLKMNDDDDDESKKTSSSAQIVASVDDLVLDIIQRLPLKLTVQLSLVSKYWNSLILNSKLCLSRNRPAVGLIFGGLVYGHGNPPNSYIIFLNKSISPTMRMLTQTKDPWFHRFCTILQSCNGLLLCIWNPKYHVCNPTTGKYIELPEVVVDHSKVSIHGMYLAFDPSKSRHYKVVCVLRCLPGWLYLFKVYSSETGLWKKGGELFKDNGDFDADQDGVYWKGQNFRDGVVWDGKNYEDGVHWKGASFEDGVYWNEAIHWVNIVTKQSVFLDNDRFTKTRESVYLNLDCDQTLKVKVFPKPPLKGKCYDRNDYYFGESCNHLYFVDAYRTESELIGEFIVYEMKRDYSEWLLKYKVNIDFSGWYLGHPFMRPDTFKWYTVVRGKNDEDSFLVVASGQKMVRYDFGQTTCEILYEFEATAKDRSVCWGLAGTFQFIKSLCSV